MYFTYVLHSDKTGRFYTGSTIDLVRRVRDHNAGNTVSTKSGIPWKLVYSEAFPSLREARQREREIKAWKSPAYMVKMLGLDPISGERPDSSGR